VARYPALLVLIAVGLLGCAEATLVHSAPSGARVYYRDRFIGVTPTRLIVPHEDLRSPMVIRLEADGYQPQDVNVPTTIGKGRVVGGIFTLGINWIFKPPTTLVDRVDVPLTPVSPVTAAPTIPPAPPAEPAVGAPARTDPAARLRRLNDLYERGYINETEYQRRRSEILKGL